MASLLDVPAIPHDFGFTEEHDLARQQARRFLEERSSIGEIRRLVDDPRGYDEKTWKDLAALGWLGLTAKEEYGGLGLDSLHQALLLDEMGRVLLPSPYFASLLASWVIEEGAGPAQRKTLLPAIVSGERVATLALSEPGASWDASDVSATAEPCEGGFVLRGVKTHVLFGNAASVVVIPCRESGDGVALYAVDVPSQGVTMEAETSLDSTRRMARLTLDTVRVGKEARLEGGPAGDGLGALRAVHLRGAALLASEMVGGIERTLAITRDYAATRIQFGRPIGAFQAVKHPIVDMMLGCEAARSLALGAAVALDRDPGSAEALSRSAKAQASDVYLFAVKKGIQLHGGFGFTWDCDVHFYFKRAMWSRGMLGDAAWHRARIAEGLLDGG